MPDRSSSAPIAIVQARMTSTRLPGKVLKEVCGKPVLGHVLDRLRRSRLLKGICIATTTNASDNRVAAFADAHGLPCFRGDELDVLARYQGAAEQTAAKTIVRITSDCPLIDPAVIDRVIEVYQTSSADYVSNTLTRTYPIGMDTEVFSRGALEEAANNADRTEEREHVTPYIYRHPQKFNALNVKAPSELTDPQLRLTLDTKEDLALISQILNDLYGQRPNFSLADILKLISENPGYRDLNSHVPHNWLKPVSNQ